MLPVKIAALGSYLPEQIVTSAALEAQLEIPAGWVDRTTGVRERRYVTHESAVDMACAAIRQALMRAERDVADVDAFVGASSGPQQAIPCTAALVQRALAAPDGGSACFDVNATCLSFMVALQMAALLVATGSYRTLVVFSSEVGTFSRNPREHESAVLFGDAAAAAVITRAAPGEASAIGLSRFATHSSGADLTRLVGGGTHHHPNDPATTHEQNMFHMDGPAVFKKAVRLFRPFLESFLADVGWEPESINRVVPHQSSRHGVEYMCKLGFRREQIFSNLAERGNCIAASVPLALTEAVACGRVRRGDRVLLTGTGAGLTLGALALVF